MLTAICLALGACFSQDSVQFRLYSEHATRVEVCLYQKAIGENTATCLPLQNSRGAWTLSLPRAQATPFYGYRVWGPNFTYDPNWTPGSLAGFHSEVDRDGNRFNPNKLVLDPYALEVSHGLEDVQEDQSVFDPRYPASDSGPWAPKGVLTTIQSRGPAVKLERAYTDEVIYETHLKGLTANDPSVPARLRGTFKGAALKASYLHDLGVTTVEFLPVQQKASSAQNVNYWGYSTLSYFAPEHSYAYDQSPGGPSREFREMVDQFHAYGIKVYIDVVYNHTAEGGIPIYSFRGIDNALYYDLAAADKTYYNDNTGCGHNFAVFHPAVEDLVMASLHHWQDDLGVDGFRFDLAPVVANNPGADGRFNFDTTGFLKRAADEFPDTALIAEPWAIGTGTYQQGAFPLGWSEWNGSAYRDLWRGFLNMRGVENVNLGGIAAAQAGSAALFQWNGRGPANSVNFLTSHDGFTLHDLFAYNSKQNGQIYPFGPSDGGEDHNRSWDQGGSPTLQRQIVRTSLLALLLSTGSPMLTGGDEFGRTLQGNNNPYNLDTNANYLDWSSADSRLHDFTQFLLQFRANHPGLHPAQFFDGQDHNGNGLKDVTWFATDRRELDSGDFNSAAGFLAYRVDVSEHEQGAVRSIYVALNADFSAAHLQLPPTANGYAWFRAADTASWFESAGNFHPPGQEAQLGTNYDLDARAALLLVEMPKRR